MSDFSLVLSEYLEYSTRSRVTIKFRDNQFRAVNSPYTLLFTKPIGQTMFRRSRRTTANQFIYAKIPIESRLGEKESCASSLNIPDADVCGAYGESLGGTSRFGPNARQIRSGL